MADLSEEVARQLFGWKWMSWVDTPVKEAPGYPAKCRIRQFVSPRTIADRRWISFWAERELRDATGDEPLSYRYCSSMGPERCPHYGGADDILVLEEVRSKWSPERVALFLEALRVTWIDRGRADDTSWMEWGLYEPGDYSRAAIEVITKGG